MEKRLLYKNVSGAELVLPELPIRLDGKNRPLVITSQDQKDLGALGFTERYLKTCKGFQFLVRSGALVEVTSKDKKESGDVR